VSILDDLQTLLRPLRTQVANLAARALVTAIKESTMVQEAEVTLLDGETRSKIERFQNYGFSSFPRAPSDAGSPEAVVVFPNGRRDHGLIVVVDDRRFRLTSLVEGEVAIYTDQGDKMVFKRGGTIEITASTLVKVIGKLEVTGDVKLDAKLDVTGKGTFSDDVAVSKTLTATTDVVGGGKSLKNHIHSVAGATVSTTGTSSAQTGAVDGGQNTAAPS
jgi:phage baseplate assembly protein V